MVATRKEKITLLAYLLVTAVTFTVFVLPPRAGVTVPVFMIIQMGMLYYILPKKQALLALVPVCIFALNAFVSGNRMWQGVNFVVSVFLFGLMVVMATVGIGFKDSWPTFIYNLLAGVIKPVTRVAVPVQWVAQNQKEAMPIARRIIIALVISLPILLFVTIMLSSADRIFAEAMGYIVDAIVDVLNINLIGRMIGGLLVGFYLFGVVYSIFASKFEEANTLKSVEMKGDTIIITIVMGLVLVVYTLFVAIQFRYLFAQPDQLPYGLTFVTYARQGFFELLVLTFVNISAILLTVWLTSTQVGRGAGVVKGLNMYLCAITVVLLVSSFYRMWLYGYDDGLTRMRLFVFGFLIFEFIGLVATFFYIAKPKFNILMVYALVGLCYFMLLNIVPTDRIIARDQVNRYLNTGRGGVAYVTSLSADAAPEVRRLMASDDPETIRQVDRYFIRMENTRGGWRQWNISHWRALR